MGNKDEVNDSRNPIPDALEDKVGEGPDLDREQVNVRTDPARDLMDVWVRARKEALARQLAANAEIKQRWLASNPIEVSQRQRGYHAWAKVQTSVVVEAESGSNE